MPISDLPSNAALAGRVWLPNVGPAVIKVEGDMAVDITRSFPTMRDLCEAKNPASALKRATGKKLGPVAEIMANADPKRRKKTRPWLLSPIDLQVIKAAGVTFATSMIERVIEERAKGDPAAAEEVRRRVVDVIGGAISDIVPGSAKADEVKRVL